MGQTRRVSGVATSIRQEDGYTKVRYHDTDVVCFNDKHIILDSGGWNTVTTKTRMNQASNQFGLGFHIYQEKHDWYVSASTKGPNPTGGVLEFQDRMIIRREDMVLVSPPLDLEPSSGEPT